MDWSITSAEFGGTTYGSGNASVTDTFISTNQFGFNIDQLTATGLNVGVDYGITYWLNIQNATTQLGNPLYWDENSGPSSASNNAVGSIPSESFDIIGTAPCQNECTPEPAPSFFLAQAFWAWLVCCGGNCSKSVGKKRC